MPNYQNGKIYKIWSSYTDYIYIGSTTLLLSQRLTKHKNNYKKYKNNTYCYTSSFDILEYGDAKIELIENYACNNKEQLCKKEGEIIRQNKDICVNIRIEGRTRQEWCKDRIKQHNSQPYNCVCGSIVSYYLKSKHFKTDKHNQYLQDNLLHLLDL